jgi:hypothetical protein
MTDSLVLEVIGGAMDGLRRRLAGNVVSVGRKVGSFLALAMDMKVSRRHAEIHREGRVWRMREKNSKGGIWLNGKRLPPDARVSLEPGQVFLMGGSVIEAGRARAGRPDIVITEDCFADPREACAMTTECREAWERAFAVAGKKGYWEIEILAAEAASRIMDFSSEHIRATLDMTSSRRWDALAGWLGPVRPDPIFSIDLSGADSILAPPRIWKILDLIRGKKIDQGKDSPMTPADFLRGILDEGRSLAARHMAGDRKFLKNLESSGNRRDPPVSPVRKISRKGDGGDIPKEIQADAAGMNGAARDEDGPWREYVLRMERITLGFVNDAMHRSAGGKDFKLPGFDARLEDMPFEKEKIQKYLDELERALLGVLSAHRNGVGEYEKALGERIVRDLKEAGESGRKKNGLMGRDREKNLRNLRETVSETLKNARLEGMGVGIIRKRTEELINS